MKRREFFKCMAGVAAMLVLPVALPEAEPEVMGVDVAVEGADETFVSLHGTNAATPNDLGGFLLPQEYVDELMAAMKEEDRRNNVFRVRGMSRTGTWRERKPSIGLLPADQDLLVANFKQVRQSFAQFLSEGAA